MARKTGYLPAVRSVGPTAPQVVIKPSQGYEGDEPDAPDEKDPTPKKMDDGQFAALIRTAIDNAAQYDETQIQPDRLKNRRFYLGDIKEELPEREDGSKVVSYDVRDTVQALLPSMVRIFCSGDTICEFTPTRPDDEIPAKQATDYVNYLIQNRLGVRGIVDLITDAFMSKVGVVKFWWDESTRVEENDFTGLSGPEVGLVLTPVAEEEKIELVSYSSSAVLPSDISPSEDNPQPQLQPGQPLIDCKIRRITSERKLRLEAVPPEERRIDPKAREFDPSMRKMRYWGHITTKTRGQLIDMGIDEEFIDAHATGQEDDVSNTMERALRQPSEIDPTEEDLPGEDQQDIFYGEIYIRCDRDGDGHEEIVKACVVGNAYAVASEETVSQVQAAEFSSITQPHIATGRCPADDVIDIQICKSGISRNLMESLPHTVYPRLGIVEDGVNIDDVLSTQPGQPIRMKAQGNVFPITTEFVGQQALEVLGYFDEVKERRTGVSDAAQGLDPDALQSTPAGAAQAIVTASQTQIEMLARMLAETGFKTLFMGLLKEIVSNQNRPDMIQLDGTWVPMDPRPWNADMNVRVHAGLGRGTDASRAQTLMMVKQSQEAILQQGGPNNPLVTLKQYANTLTRLTKLGGFANASEFFNANPQQPPPPQPSPPVELQIAQMKDKNDQAKLAADTQLDIWKWESDVYFKCLDSAAKLGIPVPDADVLIQAIRANRLQAMPDETQVHPYPVAPPQPAISQVHAPPGFVVPTPHVAGAAALPHPLQ